MTGPKIFGKHSLRFEEPDLVVFTFVGDITAAEVRESLEDLKGFAAGRPYVLELADMTRAGTMPAEVRKQAAETLKGMPFRGVALFGASFQLRVFANLFINAVNLFTRQDNPGAFFKTEIEARAWLDERRRLVAAERAR
jgi:hypothetical protein